MYRGGTPATFGSYLAVMVIRQEHIKKHVKGHAMAKRATATTFSISPSAKLLFAATLAALSLVAAVAVASSAKASAAFDGSRPHAPLRGE